MINSLNFISSELIVLALGLVVLMGGVLGARRKFLGAAAITAVVAAIVFLPETMNIPGDIFSGMLTANFLGFSMRAFVLVGAGLAILMSINFRWPDDEHAGEYYFLLLTAVVSMMLAVSADNLLMIYLAVETLSIISYVLTCSFRKDLYSTEAGLKYFLFGALSTGIMLYGISLVYGLLGTLDLEGIGVRLAAGGVDLPLLVLAVLMVFAGLAFKASLVPFHMWVADVYEGAPWPVAAFFSIGPKALGFVLLIKVFFSYAVLMSSGWAWLAALLAIATMTLGNLAAFHQTSVKRLLAFSSIAQAGYILAAMATGLMGLKAAFFYLVIYAFMNMGAFACAAFFGEASHSDITAFKGLGRRAPLAALIFSIFLMSLAGLPPLAGFMAKFFVIMSAVAGAHYVLAGAIVANSVIAFFYYLKIIKTMYFEDCSSQEPVSLHLSGLFLFIFCLLAVLYFGIFPSGLMNILTIIFP